MAVSKSKRVTKSNKKSNSKIRNFLSVFNPSTKKGALLIYAVAFAIVGGGYMLYTSFAASPSYPPDSLAMRWLRTSSLIKISDNVKGDVQCVSVYGNAGVYGKISNCIQFNTANTHARVGTYFVNTGIFYPNTKEFFNVNKLAPMSQQIIPTLCANTKDVPYYFAGTSPITAYGTARFGFIYKIEWGVWKVKYATMNISNKTCSVSGSWMNAYKF
jgi:hypothetical protein